ncbi:hypothetical protein POM88_051493 [Heracleum sosnowskyi]|uniref:F-box associated beta-propeller type 3 domain-containing protein n=1 Tax=Heracleum sosnowskyi TaxID=360622 RepID=A0AAD8GZL0_9APIA|nr:hypothetical protein POM88_051493 [Heracleum sosnowskyi]
MITSRIHDDAGCCGATIVYPNSPEQHSVNVPLMPPFDDLEFIRSCNGVVCVFNYLHGDIYLLNPLTKMSKKLLVPPDAPLNRWKRPCLTKKVDVAFGFDCVSHDFKVLWIQYQATPTHNMDVAAVKLYSTNSDSWSKIEVGIQLPSLLHHPFSPAMRSGPVVNGVLYLEAVNAIITFDLHDELFGLISYPGFIHTRKSSVFDFEGSVAVVLETVPDGSLDEKEIGLWTLVAVSDKVAWNKMFTFGSGSEEIDWVFLYSGANQFFGKTRLGEMLYDYKKKQTKYVGLPSQSFLVRVLNHTESFLSVVSGCGNTYFSKQDKDEQHNTTPIVMKHEEQQNTTPIVMKHEEQQNTTPIVMKHEEQKNTTPIVMKHEEQTSEEGGIILNNNRDNFEEGKAKEDKHKEEEHKTSSNFIKIGDTVDLSDLLFTKKRNFLISYNQQRIEAKDLSGKYCKMKGSDDEFEVIHISKGIHGKDKKYAAPMPWFMLPYVDQDSYAITCRNCVWPGNLNLDYTGLIAFDRDGSVVRIKKNPELGDSMVFPFYQDGDMENEVLTCVRKKIKRPAHIQQYFAGRNVMLTLHSAAQKEMRI